MSNTFPQLFAVDQYNGDLTSRPSREHGERNRGPRPPNIPVVEIERE